MKVSRDFKEFLELLNGHKVRYLIVGGYAIAYHSRPRYTDDIDVWIEADPDNAQNIINALSDFGFPAEGLDKKEFSVPNKIIQLGLPPQRIDILTSIDGVDFKNAWTKRVESIFGEVPVYYIALDDLLANKSASGRDKDLADVKWIKQYSD